MRSRFIGLAGALLPVAAGAATYHVPAEYATIQAALDRCAAGDTVLVGPGTYSDSQIFGGYLGVVAILPDGVVLASEGGPDVTVIDMAPVPGGEAAGVYCGGHTLGTAAVNGFTFLMHRPSSAGVLVNESSHVEIENCVFRVDDPIVPDTTTFRNGVRSVLSGIHVSGCAFIRCMAGSGAGIWHNSGPLLVENCTFLECQNQGIRAQGGLGPGPHSLEVRDCLFQRVSSSVSGGCISAQGMSDGVLVQGCLFEEPGAHGSAGAAMAFSGGGSRVILNNVIRDMNLDDGAACIYAISGALHVTGNTFWNCHESPQPSWSASVVITFSVPVVTFENNIVAHTSGAKAISFRNGGVVTTGCNVFWDNVDGIGYTLQPTDRIADPLFCDEDNRDLTLHQSSPCLPANSLGCGLIGALGQGCGTVSVEAQSWGRTKSAYRQPTD